MVRPSSSRRSRLLAASPELCRRAKRRDSRRRPSHRFRRRREAPRSRAASRPDELARAQADRSPRSGDCSGSAALRRRKSKRLARVVDGGPKAHRLRLERRDLGPKVALNEFKRSGREFGECGQAALVDLLRSPPVRFARTAIPPSSTFPKSRIGRTGLENWRSLKCTY